MASLSSGEQYVENPEATGVEDAGVSIDVTLAKVDDQWLAPVATSGTLRVAVGGGSQAEVAAVHARGHLDHLVGAVD